MVRSHSKIYALLGQLRIQLCKGVRQRRAHPQTAHALEELEKAVAAEFPLAAAATGAKRQRPAQTRTGDHKKQSWRWYMRCRRLEARLATATRQLASHTAAKTKEGRTEQEWISRVIFARPCASGAAISQAFRDATGSDKGIVSRITIGRIKDAWVEAYVKMVFAEVSSFVAAHMASASQAKQDFAAIHLIHIQDEADLRLRSNDARDGPRMPRRSRASKVQQHVVTIVASHRRSEIPTEMEALGDKTAATLATVFEALLRRTIAAVTASASTTDLGSHRRQPRTWIVHYLVGDGINTNEAAAKLLWSCVRQRPLGSMTVYFLIVVKCATHQSALSARYAVEGTGAKIAGGTLYKEVTGTAVRMFKYIIHDYIEDFVARVRDWVSGR